MNEEGPSSRPRAAAPWLLSAALLVLAAGCANPEGAAPEKATPPPHTALDDEGPPESELMYETVLYVVADGVALSAPEDGAEPSVRIAKDERYRIAEEREGWYRLITQWNEVSAWVPASAVRTAEELAPPSVINERLSE